MPREGRLGVVSAVAVAAFRAPTRSTEFRSGWFRITSFFRLLVIAVASASSDSDCPEFGEKALVNATQLAETHRGWQNRGWQNSPPGGPSVR